MLYLRVRRAVLGRRQSYPNNCNASGVPLVGQTGEQTVENFRQIVGAMTREERLAFEQARAQARYEAEHWQEVNMARTKMNEGRRLPAACPNYPATAPARGQPKAGVRRMRGHLARAARFRLKVRYQDGLRLELDIGPAWMGILICVCAIGLPQLEPIVRRITSAS
jgi:hypothetical protein